MELVNHPEHYKRLGVEPMDVIEEFDLDCHLGFALKHIARAGHKGERRVDLEKALWYLKRRRGWRAPKSVGAWDMKAFARSGEILGAWALVPNLSRASLLIITAPMAVTGDGFMVAVDGAIGCVMAELEATL